MTTILIIAAVWLFLSLLAGGALWLANYLEDRDTRYFCMVTGATVRPLGVGTPQTVAGMRYAWWQCPQCDRSEKRRHEAGFDATRPGVHLVALDDVTPPKVWPLKRWKRRAA